MVPYLNKYVIGAAIILVALLGGFFYLHSKINANNEAIMDTLVQMKTLTDGVVILKGNIESNKELEKRTREAMGAQLAAEIRSTNGTVTSLHTLLGELKSSIEHFGKVVGDKKPDGSFTAMIDQDRGKDKAPLTTVDLKYDASKSNLTDALAGSSWRNHRERFDISFAEWRTDKDGIRSGASLKRSIFDSSDRKLGEETIPLINADAYYSMNNILKIAPAPKYTFTAGAIFDPVSSKTGAILLLDRKMNKTTGVTVGITTLNGNKTYILGTSFSFGKH